MADPVPAPGMVAHAFANLFRRDAALFVHPAYAPRMAGFLARFARASTRAAYERGLAALGQLSKGVFEAYDELALAGIGTHAGRDGYLMCYASVASARKEREAFLRAAGTGLCSPPGPVLDAEAAAELEPLVSAAVRAAFHIPDERWIDPSRFVDDLARVNGDADVEIVPEVRVTAIDEGPGSVRVATSRGGFEGTAMVIAAGIGSRELCAMLGVRLPMQPGKGYSFSVHPELMPSRVVNFADAHVVATPMGDRLRIGGTMEFDGTLDRFNPRRIEAIVRALRPYVRGIDWSARTDEWVGPRPMTPDGLPFIGRLPGSSRAFVAAGHNMLGLTLAPVTGRVVAELVTTGRTGIDLSPFAVGR
jgi:D-amino-acid dehydrogenase